MPTTLIVTNDFPPRIGGIESFVAAACAFLDHDVVVLTSTAPGASHLDRTLPYEVIRLPGPLLPTRRTGRFAAEVLRRAGATKLLFGAAAPLALLTPTLRAAGATRIVALTHGHETWWARVPGARRLLRRIGDEVDALSTISDFVTAQIWPALSPVGRTKLFRLPPPVDVAVFRPAPTAGDRPRRCVSVGRFVARKGFEILLDAWGLVVEGWSGPGATPDLIVVGDGPRRARLEQQTRRAGLIGHVRFPGALPPAGVISQLQGADVFALPVRTRLAGLEPEGLGLATLEAAACGLPVVVGASGGTPETVQHGRTGFLVDPRDRRALGELLTYLLSHPETAAVMGSRGRAFVRERFGAAQARRQLRAALRVDEVPIRYPRG
jgi:phosphatidyl-myo-inositol dimannoside synthase